MLLKIHDSRKTSEDAIVTRLRLEPLLGWRLKMPLFFAIRLKEKKEKVPVLIPRGFLYLHLVKSFFEKEAYSLEDIETLIAIKAEETIYLEFKGADALQKKPEATKKMSIQISSFANSDGGVMIYGLAEKENKADHIEFIDVKAFPKEWIQNIIDSKIRRKVGALEIMQIEKPDDPFQVIYIIKIQASAEAPHTAEDDRYYKRTSTGKRPMEEYEVRAAYYKTGKTSLSLSIHSGSGWGKHPHEGKPTNIVFPINFNVHNMGQSIETMYKLQISFPSDCGNIGENMARRNNFVINDNGSTYNLTVNNASPLFQEETETLAIIDINIIKQNVLKVLHSKVDYCLFYSNGIQKGTFILNSLIRYKGGELSPNDVSEYHR